MYQMRITLSHDGIRKELFQESEAWDISGETRGAC
jgi:hypothetical protein